MRRLVRHFLVWLLVTFASVGYIAYALYLEIPPFLRPIIETISKTLINTAQATTPGVGESPWTYVLRVTTLILLNNVRVCLLSASPFLGIVSYLTSLTVTAWVLRSLATARFGKRWMEVSMRVLYMPHTYLELLAYSIVFVEGCIATYYLAARGDIPESHVRTYAVSLAISLAVLTLAALVEACEIALSL